MIHPMVLTYGTFAASATMVGGLWLANRPQSWLTTARLRGIMALGAGFLLALVLLELLPAAVEQTGGDPHGVFGIVLLGAATVFAFDQWLAPRLSFLEGPHDQRHHHGELHGHACGHSIIAHGAACSTIGCLVVCTFFDGIALSASFQAASSLGMFVTVGLLLHLLPEGLLAASVALAAGGSAKAARRAAIATGVALMVGATLPMLLGPIASLALPFTAGILLFVALGQLIPTSALTGAGSWLVIAGGTTFWLIERYLPHGH